MITWTPEPPDPRAEEKAALARLRAEFPDWAFLVIRYRWIALRGKDRQITASSPDILADTLRREPDA